MEPVAHSPSLIGQELRYILARLARVMGLYRYLLSGPRPGAPSRSIADPWSGDAALGRAIASGRYIFAGTTQTPQGSPWEAADPPPGWLREAHGFSWLRDLAAAGGSGDDSSRSAQALVGLWLDWDATKKPGADRIAWSAAVTGRRVRAWLNHWSMLIGGESGTLGPEILNSLGRQVRHLDMIAGAEGDGEERLAAILGLVQASLMVPAFHPRLSRAVGLMERELTYSILPDGCHATRSPRLQFEVMRDLVGLRELFSELQAEVPICLVTAIDRMAPVLRFFRHGDGGLALFHDTREGISADIDGVLGRADAKGRAPTRCPHGGFERLVSGKLNVIVDAGAPPGAPYDSHAHAAPLAMEVSYGAERLIVNCGASKVIDGDWAKAQRSTAAHSTVGVEDTNADEISNDGRIGRRRASTVVERNETDGAVWIDMSHDGYLKPFGVTHRRRLYLAPEGTDLRGEDRLEGTEGRTFTLRFHLHPKVQVSLLSNHSAALLKTPSGSGWRLRVSGAEMSLADSIYLGGPQDTKRTQQILLTGVTGPEGASVKWALQRETKR
jgi:uncharacterized heparinase superfamily protein